MEQQTQHPNGAPWYLVIILIVVAVGASLAAILVTIAADNMPEQQVVVEEQNEPADSEKNGEEVEEVAELLAVEPDAAVVTAGDSVFQVFYKSPDEMPKTPFGASLNIGQDDERRCAVHWWGADRSAGPWADTPEGLLEQLEKAGTLPSEHQNRFVNTVIKMLEVHNAERLITCFDGSDHYAVIDQVWQYAFPYQWTDSAYPSLLAYQPVRSMDGVSVFTNILQDNILITNGYGDAGVGSWTYYTLNHQLQTSEVIESCVDKPRQYNDPEIDFDEVDHSERVVECSVVYQ